GRFEEEGHRGLDREGGAEYVADELRVLGPIHSELELEGDAHDDSDGEIDQEEPAPVLGHPEVDLVAGPRVARLHERDQGAHAEGQRHEQEMEYRHGGELDARESLYAHVIPLCPSSIAYGRLPFQRKLSYTAGRWMETTTGWASGAGRRGADWA